MKLTGSFALAVCLVSLLCTSFVGAADSVSGRWRLVVTADGEPRDYFLDLKQEGEKVGGTFTSPRSGGYKISSGSYAKGVLRIEVPREIQGMEFTFVVEAKLGKNGELTGGLTVAGQEFGEVRILRPKPKYTLAGNWEVLAKNPEESEEYDAKIEAKKGDDDKVTGKYIASIGSFDLASVKIDGSKLTFGVTLKIEENDVPILVAAEFKDADTLVGKWSIKDRDEISGHWGAKRQKPATAKDFAGRWQVTSKSGQGEKISFVMEIKSGDDGKLKGTIVRDDGAKMELENPRVEEGKFHSTIQWKEDDGAVKVELEGGLDDAGGLRGKWKTGDASGEWSAGKQKTA